MIHRAVIVSQNVKRPALWVLAIAFLLWAGIGSLILSINHLAKGAPSMQMMDVESSNIKAIGYDFETKTLRVNFHKGTFFDFEGVPRKDFLGLLEADSIGTFFHSKIKGKFKTTKVEPEVD